MYQIEAKLTKLRKEIKKAKINKSGKPKKLSKKKKKLEGVANFIYVFSLQNLVIYSVCDFLVLFFIWINIGIGYP